jgi:hypothetical protein
VVHFDFGRDAAVPAARRPDMDATLDRSIVGK